MNLRTKLQNNSALFYTTHTSETLNVRVFKLIVSDCSKIPVSQ